MVIRTPSDKLVYDSLNFYGISQHRFFVFNCLPIAFAIFLLKRWRSLPALIAVQADIPGKVLRPLSHSLFVVSYFL